MSLFVMGLVLSVDLGSCGKAEITAGMTCKDSYDSHTRDDAVVRLSVELQTHDAGNRSGDSIATTVAAHRRASPTMPKPSMTSLTLPIIPLAVHLSNDDGSGLQGNRPHFRATEQRAAR